MFCFLKKNHFAKLLFLKDLSILFIRNSSNKAKINMKIKNKGNLFFNKNRQFFNCVIHFRLIYLKE